MPQDLSGRRLAPLTDWREEITLVPHSGIQMLDFGFRLDAQEGRPARFIERVTAETADAVERMLIPLTGDPEQDAPFENAARADDDSYSIRPVQALEPFLTKWIPVPVLRLRTDRGPAGEHRFDPGPTAWARMRVVELDQPDATSGHTHRVQLALDTALLPLVDGAPYVGPTHADAEKSREFRLVCDPPRMDWFLRRVEVDTAGNALDPQRWVSDWLDDLFMAFKRAERPGRRVSHETLSHQFEHWARYLAFLRLIEGAVKVPRLRLANTGASRDAVKPVDVDLVLDVGNSRTCGILIERFPDETRIDLARSYPLEMRDLGHPEFLHSGLFDSRVEFAEHRMGDDRHASRSGRRNAFLWPSFVRIGPEALRLVAGEEGTETASGLSSPKRYLWDVAPMSQDWRFHQHDDPNNLPKSVRAAMRHLTESGDVLAQVEQDEKDGLRPKGTPRTAAIRPRFSRSSLFGFLLAEIFAHALVQVNAPASRARRPQSELPRRLDRIILTLPTATSAQEQAILRARAQGALHLVWQLSGLTEGDGPLGHPPTLIVDWDEASCTQLVWLYSELTQKFNGQIGRFLELKGRPRVQGAGQSTQPSLRIASIDIGGGTTDLMVTTYFNEADRLLHPQQTFREGFRVAGDELVQRVISEIVLPGLRREIEAGGGKYVSEKLRELFAGDRGGQDQQAVQQRRQFALRVLMPLAVKLLETCEAAGEFDHLSLSVAEVLGLVPTAAALAEPGSVGDPKVAGTDTSGLRDADARAAAARSGKIPASLLAYLEDPAQSLGATGFRLADAALTWTREDVDAIARQVFQQMLGNLAEVIDHLGVDVVLLTGRPSRQPAVRAVLEEMLVVPPHRLVSMHDYRTGRWYPFRDTVTQRIGDPKSTVAVGGMLIALSEGRLPNFKVSTGAYRMRSTARYIGEMDTSGQIVDARLLFRDVDLDTRRTGPQEVRLKLFAPIHLGSRQLPLERWTTTPLYRLDFATPSAQRRAPLTVLLERADPDEDEDDKPSSAALLRRETQREAFRVVEVEDSEGGPLKPSEVRLKLHTLGFDDDYWIDTGLFRV